jgi:hypothetical protein
MLHRMRALASDACIRCRHRSQYCMCAGVSVPALHAVVRVQADSMVLDCFAGQACVVFQLAARVRDGQEFDLCCGNMWRTERAPGPSALQTAS